jgi:plasmid stability protein
MPTLTIRNLDDRLKQRLRLRAAQHGWSMEQEARVILAEVLETPAQNDGAAWLQRVRQRFQGVAGDDWQPSDRREGTERELPHFDP